MSLASKITGLGAALLLALGLMAPMGAWADGSRINAVIALGQSGQTLTIPDVEPDASSLLLELAVEPGTNGQGQPYALEDLAFAPSLANVRIDDVSVNDATDTIKLVVSAGPDNLFAGANGAVRLGTISMMSDDENAEATVKVTRFQTMAASYDRADYPTEGVQATYNVNSTAPNGGDGGNGNGGSGNGANGGNGGGANGGGGTYPAGYNPSANDPTLSRTGDIVMYSAIAVAAVAAAAGVALFVRSRKHAAKKEK